MENWRQYLNEAMAAKPSSRNLPEPPWGPYTQEWDVVNMYSESDAHLGDHQLENAGIVGWADNMDKFMSRKLLLTVFAVTIVAGSSLLGLNLDDESLKAIVNMVLGLVGGQALVDVAEVVRSGRKVAEVVEEVREASDE